MKNKKLSSYSISIEPISGLCKQPALWGSGDNSSVYFLLLYFQKPKWISNESFLKIVSHIKLDLPKGFEIKRAGGANEETT